jgi:hypothetical protein
VSLKAMGSSPIIRLYSDFLLITSISLSVLMFSFSFSSGGLFSFLQKIKILCQKQL